VPPYQHLGEITADSERSWVLHTPPTPCWLGLPGTLWQRRVVTGPLPIAGDVLRYRSTCPVQKPQSPSSGLTLPGEAGGKLRHGEAAEAKVNCSERTQTSWLQAQIHAQLHKDRTKETPNGCKPPPRFPPAPAELPGPRQSPAGHGMGGYNPSQRVKGTAVPQSPLLTWDRGTLVPQG